MKESGTYWSREPKVINVIFFYYLIFRSKRNFQFKFSVKNSSDLHKDFEKCLTGCISGADFGTYIDFSKLFENHWQSQVGFFAEIILKYSIIIGENLNYTEIFCRTKVINMGARGQKVLDSLIFIYCLKMFFNSISSSKNLIS